MGYFGKTVEKKKLLLIIGVQSLWNHQFCISLRARWQKIKNVVYHEVLAMNEMIM